jgi:hypothetical protein
MKHVPSDGIVQASALYVAYRRGGAPPARARQELALPESTAAKLEQLLQSKAGGPQSQRPRFARHGEHVASVLAHGGFPAMRRP